MFHWLWILDFNVSFPLIIDFLLSVGFVVQCALYLTRISQIEPFYETGSSLLPQDPCTGAFLSMEHSFMVSFYISFV